jgi:hypothetical protein
MPDEPNPLEAMSRSVSARLQRQAGALTPWSRRSLAIQPASQPAQDTAPAGMGRIGLAAGGAGALAARIQRQTRLPSPTGYHSLATGAERSGSFAENISVRFPAIAAKYEIQTAPDQGGTPLPMGNAPAPAAGAEPGPGIGMLPGSVYASTPRAAPSLQRTPAARVPPQAAGHPRQAAQAPTSTGPGDQPVQRRRLRRFSRIEEMPHPGPATPLPAAEPGSPATPQPEPPTPRKATEHQAPPAVQRKSAPASEAPRLQQAAQPARPQRDRLPPTIQRQFETFRHAAQKQADAPEAGPAVLAAPSTGEQSEMPLRARTVRSSEPPEATEGPIAFGPDLAPRPAALQRSTQAGPPEAGTGADVGPQTVPAQPPPSLQRSTAPDAPAVQRTSVPEAPGERARHAAPEAMPLHSPDAPGPGPQIGGGAGSGSSPPGQPATPSAQGAAQDVGAQATAIQRAPLPATELPLREPASAAATDAAPPAPATDEDAGRGTTASAAPAAQLRRSMQPRTGRASAGEGAEAGPQQALPPAAGQAAGSQPAIQRSPLAGTPAPQAAEPGPASLAGQPLPLHQPAPAHQPPAEWPAEPQAAEDARPAASEREQPETLQGPPPIQRSAPGLAAGRTDSPLPLRTLSGPEAAPAQPAAGPSQMAPAGDETSPAGMQPASADLPPAAPTAPRGTIQRQPLGHVSGDLPLRPPAPPEASQPAEDRPAHAPAASLPAASDHRPAVAPRPAAHIQRTPAADSQAAHSATSAPDLPLHIAGRQPAPGRATTPVEPAGPPAEAGPEPMPGAARLQRSVLPARPEAAALRTAPLPLATGPAPSGPQAGLEALGSQVFRRVAGAARLNRVTSAAPSAGRIVRRKPQRRVAAQAGRPSAAAAVLPLPEAPSLQDLARTSPISTPVLPQARIQASREEPSGEAAGQPPATAAAQAAPAYNLPLAPTGIQRDALPAESATASALAMAYSSTSTSSRAQPAVTMTYGLPLQPVIQRQKDKPGDKVPGDDDEDDNKPQDSAPSGSAKSSDGDKAKQDSTTTAQSAGDTGDETASKPDLDELARQIVPLIKRMLAVERERRPR